MARAAVIGGGWAGLAAAVGACERGFEVSLFETAAQLGGRARAVELDGLRVDNGQHILIGAYVQTLALMRRVGVDPDTVLLRGPLALPYPDGSGLRLPHGAPLMAFLRGVLGYRGWAWSDKLALLGAAARWAVAGFRCPPAWTVAELVAGWPARPREELIDPLCVAALNTPSRQASAAVFLRVLHDALFSGPGCADLLLPRVGLSELLPEAAGRWLQAHGATLRLGARAMALERDGERWRIDGEPFERVIVACSATEAARLVEPHAPAWAAQARGLRYEPIVTVYLEWPGLALPQPLTALRGEPAQFVFDHGALSGRPGLLAFVVSGARPWTERGLAACGDAVLAQARAAFPTTPGTPRVLRTLAEKRATFLCLPAMLRPPAAVAPDLWAAGDYVDGPYPATLEGAVRAGEAAALAL